MLLLINGVNRFNFYSAVSPMRPANQSGKAVIENSTVPVIVGPKSAFHMTVMVPCLSVNDSTDFSNLFETCKNNAGVRKDLNQSC